ncbi:MAG: acyl-CoA dehydrogenase family protein [Polyangiaceae bacterium]
MSRALSLLLTTPPDPAEVSSLEAWRARHEAAVAGLEDPADRALAAGFAADRVAYAFAGGYSAALDRLTRGKLQGARAGRATSLCITEEGGGHPNAVKTALAEHADGRRTLTGKKQWATGAPLADVLLIAASTGLDAQGRNRLALVAIDARAPGVKLEKMPDPPFAPELPHARIELDAVAVTSADVLPGDGYEVYVKPFRTIEDAHVFLALLGHLVRCARLYAGPRDFTERALASALALHAVAAMDPSAPETHLALAGALDLGRALVAQSDAALASAPPGVRARWERDRALTMVAERARSAQGARVGAARPRRRAACELRNFATPERAARGTARERSGLKSWNCETRACLWHHARAAAEKRRAEGEIVTMRGTALVALLLGSALLFGAGCKEESSGAAPAAADGTGVAECDQYMKELDACFAANPAAKTAMEATQKQMREAWKASAQTAEGKAMLKTQCAEHIKLLGQNPMCAKK